MAVFSSKAVDVKNAPATSTIGGNELVFRASIVFPTTITLATNDVMRFVRLPKGFVLTSVELDHDAMGTSAVCSVGILNTGETAVASAAITGAAIATAGLKVDNSSAARRVAVSDVDQVIGAVITTGAGAALSAGAKIGLTIRYRPKQIVQPD